MIKRYSIHFIVPLTADKVPKYQGKDRRRGLPVQGLGHTVYTENAHDCLMTASFLGMSMY